MVLKTDKPIVLASGSPSRKMLLERAGVDFEVVVSGVNENVPENFTPAQTVECLAKRKGEAVFALRPEAAVIAADSVIVIDGDILGKPKDNEEARATLHRLSGRNHHVYTGVCIMVGNHCEVFHQATELQFYSLTDEEIDEYVATGEPMGRAGSYGIEGIGVMLVQSICGDYSNIVGLPVAETLRRLKRLEGE